MTQLVIPPWLFEIAGRVEDRLRRFLDDERRTWTTMDPALVGPFDALETAVLGGGKRLRPVFCYWGWVCAGGAPDAPGPADDLGAAFELLHAFALVHDDVMDDAALRRGHPTTHVAFAEIHREQGLRGDDRLFGEGVAILVGDLAHVYAGSIVATMPPATRTRWRTMQLELMAGQYLDLWCAAHGEVDARRSKLIARLKSGRYTIEQPLLLGASLLTDGVDEGPSAVDDALVAYGEPLGMAFQLRDDLLGAVGDPAVTGKPVGDDLRTGKPTLLLVSALERADDAQRATLARVGDADLGDDEVAELQAVLAETGALEAVEEEITTLSAASRAALDVEVIPDSARSALNDLVDLVSFRSS